MEEKKGRNTVKQQLHNKRERRRRWLRRKEGGEGESKGREGTRKASGGQVKGKVLLPLLPFPSLPFPSLPFPSLPLSHTEQRSRTCFKLSFTLSHSTYLFFYQSLYLSIYLLSTCIPITLSPHFSPSPDDDTKITSKVITTRDRNLTVRSKSINLANGI